jgi:hypothetical protein
MSAEPQREEILMQAANGNKDALEFLRVYARRAHWVDDLCDRDKLDVGAHYGANQLAPMEAEWLLMIAVNPFFQTHRPMLVPAMILALNAWKDSELPTFTYRAQRDIIKGQWHEVIWLVAFVTGGWEKMSATSRAFRAYDLEECKTSNQEESNGLPGK